jgi:cell division protein FtsB
LYKLIAFLLLLIAVLQYRLWQGDGSIREYREIIARIEELKQEGERRRIRNAAVAADVRDLREGTEAVEERARQELGMIKPGETFVQVYEDDAALKPVEPSADVSYQPAADPRRSAAAPLAGKSAKQSDAKSGKKPPQKANVKVHANQR